MAEKLGAARSEQNPDSLRGFPETSQLSTNVKPRSVLDDLEQFWEENDPEYRKLKIGGQDFVKRPEVSAHMMDAKNAAEAFR